MKKLALIIAAFILCAQSTTYAIGLDFGVEFALSQANLKVKDSNIELDNNLGYGVGVSAKVNLPLIDVGPELWYYRHTASDNNGGKIKSNSLDLPVVVAYNILGPLTIEGGPSFSLSNSAKYESGSSSIDLNRIRPEMGYVVGVRVTLFKMLMISGRFNGCFSRESVDFGGGSSYDVRFNAWSVAVGAKF